MTDLHVQLRAAIEQRLATAREATPGPWSTPGPDTIAEWSIYADQRGWMVATAAVNSYPESAFPKLRSGITGDEANRNAAFIAANGPDVIVRQCEADLRLLAIADTARTSYGQRSALVAAEIADQIEDILADAYAIDTEVN